MLAVALINPVYRLYMMEGHPKPIVTLGLDLRGGVEVLLRALPEDGTAPTEDQLNGVLYVVRNRVDPQGTKEVSLTQVGLDRILLQVPGEKNSESVLDVIGDTALLEFVNTGEDGFDFKQGDSFNDEVGGQRKEEFAKYETILHWCRPGSCFCGFQQ